MSKHSRVVAVSTSEQKGTTKTPQPVVRLLVGHGVEGDAHAGDWHRQVSLLGMESIGKAKAMGALVDWGSFAENITTEGLVLFQLPIGTILRVGKSAVLRITQIGKECHVGCAIRQLTGDCVMPREGIFAEVLQGGEVQPGDEIAVWPLRSAGVITLSDRGFRGERDDGCGPLIAEWLRLRGFTVHSELLPDERALIVECLTKMADEEHLTLVLTTGGTGFSPRDVTPEATLEVLDRQASGLAEGLRYFGLQKTPRAMLSRAVAGLRDQTLIVNLPGSPKAVAEYLEVLGEVLPHALQVSSGQSLDCATEETV